VAGSDLQSGAAAALLTTFFFSISAVSGSRVSRALGGTEANFLRILLATTFLGLYAHLLGGGLGGHALPFFLLSGLIGFGIGDLSLFQAYPLIGSRLCMILVHCLAAPIAALVEWLWLGTALTLFQVCCSLLILVGVALALAPGEHLHIARKALIAGVAFGLIAALGQGFGSVVSRKAYFVAEAAGENIDGITAAYQRIWGGVAFATLGYVAYRWRLADAKKTSSLAERVRPVRNWVLVNGLAGPVLGVSCFQFALSKAPTGIVLPIVALTPLMIIPFAQRFENEKPSRRSLAGGLIAVAGVVALRFSLK
jgi:drug/metabolite transporter (DMT)-like permease